MMQRIRIGLTGLAFVFLLVLIAATGLKPERSAAPAGSEGETLGVLGVTPGAGSATAGRSVPTARRDDERPRERTTKI